jgi:two-component system CheB/CheR fusion protein
MNEELQTLNQENRHKVEELALLSSDLQNLLTATEIATLFLDRELRILRFTPKVGHLFNMRMTDRGRPVSDITHRLGYPGLKTDAEHVLRHLTRIEREVKDELGSWYLTHLLPYRSADDRIAGVVITFVDITSRKTQEEQIQLLSRSLEERVAERTRQVRELTTSLVRAEQRERRRLAATLHDELQQLLFSVTLKLRLAREAGAVGRLDDMEQHIGLAEKMLADSIRLTRQLGVDLNPPILKNEGMRAMLEWLRGQMRELHDLSVQVESPHDIQIEDSDARVLMFQVLRELLFNVAKHSGSKSARVALDAMNGELRVQVSDDGRGFDPEGVGGNDQNATTGLTHVKERVNLLGGRMSIDSARGNGVRIVLMLPVTARIGTT